LKNFQDNSLLKTTILSNRSMRKIQISKCPLFPQNAEDANASYERQRTVADAR